VPDMAHPGMGKPPKSTEPRWGYELLQRGEWGGWHPSEDVRFVMNYFKEFYLITCW